MGRLQPATARDGGRGMSRAAAPRVWQRMLSGRRLDLIDPSPLDIEIEDIAHGLARVARWNGQTRGAHAFSVAQHSLIVEALAGRRLADPRWRLAALLHDGPEYVIGDMISPFKGVLGNDYRSIEARLQGAIHLRFGLPRAVPKDVARVIKSADKVSAYYEATLLAGFTEAEARSLFCRPPQDGPEPEWFAPRPAEEVEAALVARFHALDAALNAGSQEPAIAG